LALSESQPPAPTIPGEVGRCFRKLEFFSIFVLLRESECWNGEAIRARAKHRVLLLFLEIKMKQKRAKSSTKNE